MRKPSIFSRDYEKEVKKRRMRIFLLAIVPLIGLTIFLITDFDVLMNKGISMKKGINNILLNKSKEDAKDIENKTSKEKKEELVEKNESAEKPKDSKVESSEKLVADNEIFVVLLSDGQEISITYNLSAGEKNIESVSDTKNISYDISPSKKALVIQSKINQDMIYVDESKVSKDITKKTHKSSKGKVFPKQDKLKENPNYIWSVRPKFIDEDRIVYVSELPWMNAAAAQYIWKVNLKDNVHTQVKPTKGKSITFKNITAKGLETIIDGNAFYVTSTGKVVK